MGTYSAIQQRHRRCSSAITTTIADAEGDVAMAGVPLALAHLPLQAEEAQETKAGEAGEDAGEAGEVAKGAEQGARVQPRALLQEARVQPRAAAAAPALPTLVTLRSPNCCSIPTNSHRSRPQ